MTLVHELYTMRVLCNGSLPITILVLATIDLLAPQQMPILHVVRSELAQEKLVGACKDQETTFSGLNVATGSSFMVCAYGNDLDLSGCRTATNGPESEPERVTVRVS